jgi:hypothetical protein
MWRLNRANDNGVIERNLIFFMYHVVRALVPACRMQDGCRNIKIQSVVVCYFALARERVQSWSSYMVMCNFNMHHVL